MKLEVKSRTQEELQVKKKNYIKRIEFLTKKKKPQLNAIIIEQMHIQTQTKMMQKNRAQEEIKLINLTFKFLCF